MRRFGFARRSLVAGAILNATALAGCTTYGTGESSMMGTVAGLIGINPNSQPIQYQTRPGLVTPSTATLPPPGTGTPPQNFPTNTPYTTGPAGTVPPSGGQPLTENQQAICRDAQQLLLPPPEYCVPDPSAPMVPAGGGFFN